MKKFIPLAALLLLVSCGSGDSENNQVGGSYKLSEVSEGCSGSFSPELQVEQSGGSVSLSSSGTAGSVGSLDGSSSDTAEAGVAVNTSKNASTAEAPSLSQPASVDASGSVDSDGGFVATGDDVECSGQLDASGAAPKSIECKVVGSNCTLTYELVSTAPASSI